MTRVTTEAEADDSDSRPFSSITGELRDRVLEERFLDEAWPRVAWQLRIAFGACAMGAGLMVFANLADDQLDEVLLPVAGARVIQFLCLTAGCLWGLHGRRPVGIFALVTVGELATVATEMVNLTLALAPKLQGENTVGTPFVVLLIFMFYTLIPNRFAVTTAICLLFMVADAIAIYFVMGQSISIAGYVLIQLLFVNIMGFGYGRYINRLQRQDYLSRMHLEQELTRRRAAERRAEVSSEQKSRFIAVAGHDLRQPLFALGLWVDALQERLGQSEAARELDLLTGKIVKARDNLGELLNRLLHVAHLDSGTTEVNVQPVRAGDLLQEIEARFTPLAAERGQRFRVIGSSVEVHSDPVLLGRILDNLVDNAIKYGEQNGRATVGVRRVPGALRFEIWNSGQGIPADQIEEIFDEYHQLGEGRRTLRGLGLGLSIVQRLGDLLGHRVGVRSQPGGLTVFSVEVQRSETVDAAVVEMDRAAGRVPERILVLDDDTDIREALALTLSGWGAEVVACRSGSEAVGSLEGFRPDLIISDLGLGDEDGLEVVAHLRERLGADVPVVLVTGDTAADALRRAMSAGHRLLHKPVTPDELRETLHELAA